MSKRLVLSLLPAVALSLVALAIFLTGCGTMRNILIDDPACNRVFGGVRYDAETAVQCIVRPPAAKTSETDPPGDKTTQRDAAATPLVTRPFRWVELSTTVVDAPFSVAGDTITLPWVVYTRLRKFAELHEQSSPPSTSAEKP
jgi:uncharacterized protein YceK